jgi:hypothetical protein
MNTIELKHSIQNSIDNIQDENILKAIYAMVTEYLNGEIVGSIAGKPLTQTDILRRCIEAENDIREGRVHTLEQIKDKIKTGFGRK